MIDTVGLGGDPPACPRELLEARGRRDAGGADRGLGPRAVGGRPIWCLGRGRPVSCEVGPVAPRTAARPTHQQANSRDVSAPPGSSAAPEPGESQARTWRTSSRRSSGSRPTRRLASATGRSPRASRPRCAGSARPLQAGDVEKAQEYARAASRSWTRRPARASSTGTRPPTASPPSRSRPRALIPRPARPARPPGAIRPSQRVAPRHFRCAHPPAPGPAAPLRPCRRRTRMAATLGSPGPHSEGVAVTEVRRGPARPQSEAGSESANSLKESRGTGRRGRQRPRGAGGGRCQGAVGSGPRGRQ